MPFAKRMPPEKIRLAHAMRRAPTWAEAMVWAAVRRKALGVRIHRQVPMLGYIVDFYCPAAHLVIEVDGHSHVGREAVDRRRDQILAQWGLVVIRVSNAAVADNLTAVIATVREAILARSMLLTAVKKRQLGNY